MKWLMLFILSFVGLVFDASAQEGAAADDAPLISDKEIPKKKVPTKVLTTMLGPEAKNAWSKKGFRLRTGYASEYRVGEHLAPTHWAHGITFEPTYQLDADWALSVQLSYTVNAAAGEFNGLMWNTFLNTDVRLVQHLRMSFGVGFAGILGNPPQTRENQDNAFAEKAYALGSRMAAVGQELTSCYGYGPAVNLNVTYIAPWTPYFAVGPVLGVKSQHVQCSETGIGGPTNLETGRGIEVWQWWVQNMPYAGLYMAWR